LGFSILAQKLPRLLASEVFIFACIRHAIIMIMNTDEIRFHLRDRWKAVEEFERQELRAMTLEQHWQKLNAIVRFAIETGMKRDDDDNEMEVFMRWAKLKGAV
jgi:hypothetical protein